MTHRASEPLRSTRERRQIGGERTASQAAVWHSKRPPSLATLVAIYVVLGAVCVGCGRAQPAKSQSTAVTETRVPAEPPVTAGGGFRALLIGCTKYPGLKISTKSYDLVGPRNDVVLMEKLLVEKFRFPPQSIVKLTEDRGGAAGRPTRANIEREFKRLAQSVKPGDKVVIAMSGHGSRQADFLRPNPKLDGMSELFLPADTGNWNKQTKRVENAIIDFELRDWLAPIQAAGASVWLIVDACHSGTIARGDEVARGVPPEDLTPQAILDEAVQETQRRAAGLSVARSVSERGAALFDQPERMPNLVAMYAALPTEPTIELPLPPTGGERQVHGLLTYTLCHVLFTAEMPLTYRDLLDRVYAQYSVWGRTSPTPLVEGQGRNSSVLGDQDSSRRAILLARAGAELKIDAGALQGLTEGTVLAVRPPAGKADAEKVLGYVQIPEKGLRVLDATVVPCAYEAVNAPQAADLPAAARCEAVVLDLGQHRITVAVDVTAVSGEAPQSVESRKHRGQDIQQQLQNLSQAPTALFTVVEDPVRDHPAWLVRVEPEAVFLVLASELAPINTRTPAPIQTRFGPVPAGDALVPWLDAALTKIARVETLKRVATKFQNGQPGERQQIKLESQMMLLRDPDDKGQPLGKEGGAVPVLHNSDWFACDLTNRSAIPVDVNILFVNGDYGVDLYYPEPGLQLDNRLPPGKTMRTPAVEIDDKTTGVEHLIVVATKSKAQGQPVDLSSLVQPGVNDADRQLTARTIADQLEVLFPESGVRSFRRPDIEQIQFRVFVWRTEKTIKSPK